MTTLVSAKNITKLYGKGANTTTALLNISFEIESGETIAIVGKSGSGKSTLMHQLALLDSPTTGSLSIGTKLSTGLKESELDAIRNEQFGFIFQQFFLNGNDSVLENVTLPLKVAGIPKKERIARAQEVLTSVDLLEKSMDKANNLSGGQKQRVCIARALINNPSVIFADEPTGNLDSKTSQVITNLLFKLNKEKKITLIIVTHDQDLANKCSRQLHIQDGMLQK
jgi:putative ABC transport system ATP-binding protein